jgi:cobyrinic acid a,c-diamide synthase
MNQFTIPRIVTAALKGGAGKTLLTVGIVAALTRRGLKVAPFKKGPDYIDAGWLGLAAGSDCHNLDAYLFSLDTLQASFRRNGRHSDISVIEGNRGLFDGVDSAGGYSTAELAKSLNSPLILIIDATKMTRTAAALALGAKAMDPQLRIEGVILNRVAGSRHEKILRDSIESATGIPVIGSVSKLSSNNFPQRHLGLAPIHEQPEAMSLAQRAGEMAEARIDIDRIIHIARRAEPFKLTYSGLPEAPIGNLTPGVKIGVIRDSAFQFYYPENLNALTDRGATLVEFSALNVGRLPELDALYIGGGFPETHAALLAENKSLKESIFEAAQAGLPIYAECGGLMYLTRSLRIDERNYPMVGVFPLDTVLMKKPQGLGYITAQVTHPNPFYPLGATISGHEFHYSRLEGAEPTGDTVYAFKVVRGSGMGMQRDGLVRWNCLGTYLHVHALGQASWAEGILKSAQAYRRSREGALPLGPVVARKFGR